MPDNRIIWSNYLDYRSFIEEQLYYGEIRWNSETILRKQKPTSAFWTKKNKIQSKIMTQIDEVESTSI